jgi:hypothetical protein
MGEHRFVGEPMGSGVIQIPSDTQASEVAEVGSDFGQPCRHC